MIRGSDGLDYENLTEKLLSNPADTHLNTWVKRLRAQGRTKEFVQAWTEAYETLDGRVGPAGGKVNSFHNAGSAIKAAEAQIFAQSQAAHVAGNAADGAYDLPAAQDRRSPG